MSYQMEELIDSYGEKLLRYATSILYNHHDAEDIVQDVFLCAYQNQNNFDGQNLSAWLYKITYHKCLNKIKRNKFIVFGSVPENTVAPEATGFSEETLYALKLLKPQDRALLFGRIVEGYSYEELAKQMGCSSTSLRKRYERARSKLKSHLGSKKICVQN